MCSKASSDLIACTLGCLLCWQLYVGHVAAQSQSEVASEEKVVVRLKEISILHRNLFSEFSVELQMPVRVGSVDILIWTVEDLVAQLSANILEADVQNAVVNLLDEALIEQQSGYFLLDDEAREAVHYQPKSLRAALTSSDITEYWGTEEDPTSGWYGAKHYLIRRDATVTQLQRVTPEQRRVLWLKHLRSFAFINNKFSVQEQARERQLINRQLNAGFSQPSLTDEERSEIDHLGVWLGKQPFSSPQGANILSVVALSSENIASIVTSRSRRPWSTPVRALVGVELHRVADRLIQVLPPELALRLAGLVVDPLAADTDDNSMVHQRALWFMATRKRGVPTIEGSGSAVFSGFAVCAFNSILATKWDMEKLLSRTRPQSSQDTKNRWLSTHEVDYREHAIFKLPLIVERNDLTSFPTYSYHDIMDQANRIIRGFDRCVNNYFSFVMAHELAHIYLDDTGKNIEFDELKVDCAAMQHIRRLHEHFRQLGETAPAQGFMKHLLAAANSLEQPLTTEGFLKDKFKERYAVMLKGGCGS